jgi:integrase
MTPAKAALELERLKQASRLGEGPVTIAERREKSEAKRQAEVEAKELQAKDALSFGDFWRDTYFPQARKDKTPGSWEREDQFFRLWLDSLIGKLPLKDVSPIHLEKVKSNMAKAARAPRSIQYCLAVVRQVFNHARRLGLYQGDPPTSKIKKPTPNNARLRFLTQEEANNILAALAVASPEVHDMALLSMYTGMRAGEVRTLAWSDVDLAQGLLVLRDTKNGRTRYAYMTEAVKSMLQARQPGRPDALVFCGPDGKQRSPVAKTFRHAVDRLGLNDGVVDRRQRVSYHTLRHSYASWLVMQGIPLYTVQKLLGHRTPAMTERYSHLAPDHMREAIKGLEEAMATVTTKVVKFNRQEA